jgi:hypothetical protein
LVLSRRLQAHNRKWTQLSSQAGSHTLEKID